MIVHDDCLRYMQLMEPNSVDAIVTDPPYGLSFMGKGWDKGVPGVEFWQAAFRVMKPGAYLLAFGGTRTFHRMAVAIEDAGFEIRDTLSWLYGSGFPKSHDVGKAIDKLAGAEREVVGTWRPTGTAKPRMRGGHGAAVTTAALEDYERQDIDLPITAPATDAAKQWDGWGTALKPAWEPVIVARKPLEGTVAANVLTHGTGAINVDACRIGTDVIQTHGVRNGTGNSLELSTYTSPEGYVGNTHTGRWPANVVLDEEAAALLDAQSGERGSTLKKPYGDQQRFGKHGIYSDGPNGEVFGYGDTGGASRFFYTAKSSRAERNAGLEGMPERDVAQTYGLTAGGNTPQQTPHAHRPQSNGHPTVKPISLMRWLVRLVTPPGGTVLDPFAGSGTTGCAAALEGFQFIGIERESEYVAIAERRIAHWAAQSQQLTFAEVAS